MDTIDISSVVVPNSGTRVFKDDCMFSFDTALEPCGLDVCLTCHQAFSRGEFKYTQMHSEFYDHKIYLNIKKTRKQLNNDLEQPKKMIKLEVKESSEDDLFDTVYSLYFSEKDLSVSYPNNEISLKITQAVEGVINSTSTEKKNEIKAWEQEIRVCPHARSILQTPISNLQLKQCSNCDLKENLWICLHCGSLGCGRSQFGGVAGNSHAMAHQKEHPEHAVAVKLGSLSSDIADCYCYICDDEVKVPNLAVLLQTYGIDISNFVKTEKSLTELQIEQNIQWDFKMTGDGDETLQPVFGAGLTGFKNLGNSCYLASVLQVMFTLEEFQKAFFNSDGVPLDKILGNLKPYEDLETQMFKIGDGLLSGRYSIPDETTSETIKYQRGLKPSGFKALIGEGHPEFSTMQQQDTYEFWSYLVDQLEKNKVNGALETSPVNSLKFIVENKIKCTKCNSVRLKQEITDSLSVPIKVEQLEITDDGERVFKETSVMDSMLSWNDIETFDYACPKCGGKEIAVKQEGFKSTPRYLVINPQRIVLENWVPTKVAVPIKFDETLDINGFVSEGLLDGEVELPLDDNEGTNDEFEFDQTILSNCMEMGFSENRAKHAAYATNNTSSEAAVTWLFEHMDDSTIDDPFVLPSVNGKKSGVNVNAEQVATLISMGFGEAVSKKALILNNGNMEGAVEWLFSNPNDDGVIKDEKSEESELIDVLREEGVDKTKYELVAVICHKGTSIHSGHYVAFLRKEIDGESKWVLFNDEKVVIASASNLKEIEKSGHLYVYQKV
ncbi:hypothetical protein CANINC_000969 [Pichia inconspicua]|uniref:Ubiquitin carboxyl-terminal hydrolase n=1 Tax=Pichia inconspicua TaxID=52247 RepID=A0A4T0X4U5_9ASCO|nr:hypothetical protein CANINC_000969 [[Candida] inconspicua]